MKVVVLAPSCRKIHAFLTAPEASPQSLEEREDLFPSFLDYNRSHQRRATPDLTTTEPGSFYSAREPRRLGVDALLPRSGTTSRTKWARGLRPPMLKSNCPKFELCDAAGNDVSSSAIAVTALQVVMVSTNACLNVQDAGNANPDSNFRFDGTLGPTGGYIFNLQTTGLATGTYVMTFAVAGDPTTHNSELVFQVR